MPRDTGSGRTREQLIAAAADAFREAGFEGTDTNRIARRAGFAPQTFYRWFKDKTEVFLAVYRAWEEEERALAIRLLKAGADPARSVEAFVEHHRDYRLFRRSLRRLSLEEPRVRAARAESRLRQLERLGRPDDAEAATLLLQMERLSDALAEGELADMGLDEAAARTALAGLLSQVRSAPRRQPRA